MDMKLIMKAIFRTMCIIANNLYAIPAYLVWMTVLLPLRYSKPRIYWFIEGHLFHWMLKMVSNWSWTAGYAVTEVGDDVTPCLDDECLLVCNHQSTGDVPVIMFSMADKPYVANNMMWIMDILFKYTNFGLVSQMHQDFFIQQGKDTRQQQLVDLHNHVLTVSSEKNKNKWTIVFPEGGFLWKRRETSKKFAIKSGYPDVHHVTLPRTGAMEVIMNALTNSGARKKNGLTHNNGIVHPTNSGKIKWIIDVTIGYPDAKPLDAFCIFFGHRPPCKTTLLYRIYPLEEIPTEGNQLLLWLFKIWEEKDKYLEEFYETGKFPSDACKSSFGSARPQEHVLKVDRWEMIAIHCFFLASTYVQYCVFRYLLSYVW